MTSATKATGTLVDSEIRHLARAGELITDGFVEEGLRQACYELRASDIYYDLAMPDRSIQLNEGETILLKPKQTFVLITQERLELPADMLGRVLSKGQLFSLGLVPVNTYADPGFTGRLGIVMHNASNDYIALPQFTTIAKIEFVRLSMPVEKPYSGQHGYESKIWPIQHQFKLTDEQIANDHRIEKIPEELAASYGRDFGSLTLRIFRYERRLLLAAIVYFFVLIAVLSLSFVQEDRLNVWVGIALGVLSNGVFWAITSFATSARRRTRR